MTSDLDEKWIELGSRARGIGMSMETQWDSDLQDYVYVFSTPIGKVTGIEAAETLIKATEIAVSKK